MATGTVLLELLLSLARVRGRGLRLFGLLRGRFRVRRLRLLGGDGRQSGENSEPSYQCDAEYRFCSFASSFAFPSRKHKSVDDPGPPRVQVARGRKLPRIAAVDSEVMRKEKIESEIHSIRVFRGQTVAGVRAIAKCLLPPDHWHKYAFDHIRIR